MTRNTKPDSSSEFEATKNKKATAQKASPKKVGTDSSLKTKKESPSIGKKADTQSTTAAAAPKASSDMTQTKFSSNIPSGTLSVGKRANERPAVVASSDRKPESGIDAMSLLRFSKDSKSGAKGRPGGPRLGKSGTHRSAAEVIAKTTSRDHPKPSSSPKSGKTKKPSKPTDMPKKSAKSEETGVKSRLTPKVPIPPEPKGPIGGIGIEKPVFPLIEGKTIATVLNADHPEPFSFFGMHKLDTTDAMIVRVFFPEASSVKVLDTTDSVVATLKKVHDEGLFAGEISGYTKPFPYRLRVATHSGKTDVDDPYRFPPVLSDKSVEELAKGQCVTIYKLLGAHPAKIDGVDGVTFAVWAPNASHVSVVGDFNVWDGRRHGMRFRHDCGVWEIFLPGVKSGALYKYEIKHAPGTVPEVKSDPCAFYTELPLGTASIVYDDGATFRWRDKDWMESRKTRTGFDKPLSFYEVHLGSWRRKPEEDSRWLSYREMADDLVSYCADMGFTHIALLPISEHVYDDTVGYLPSNLYAPTNRYGTPDDFRYFIDACHKAGIGVVADWVPNYFSEEEHGLTLFDGTALYDHHNAWQGRDPDWNVPLYNLTRSEVVNYLISNALYWFEYFHLDGLRIGGLAKMLYLDYGRSEGEWTPNAEGGNENLDALVFIRRLNDLVAKEYPGAMMIAEDSSLRGDLTKPISEGGLGFTWRWNTAWVYDTLRYLGRHPVYRKYYQFELTNPLSYAFDEKFVLPVSHDHTSIGQGAISNKISGDYWQKFATLRAWYALMYSLPNKKLLFMGTEFAQDREWNSNISLDWHLLDNQMHLGVQGLIRDLNNLYLKNPALHEMDSNANGFEWIDTADDDSSVISFLRFTEDRTKFIVVVTHITPVVRPNYRIGVPEIGRYREILNTDAEIYGGGNQGSEGGATAEQHWAHGREYSICVTLPPYATVILELEQKETKAEKGKE
uniref:1,4-alpha-glucan branching enzyme GlgB n=1 Tax=Candidatus Kentrum sp. TUN TaxID=2126343 RepID=A0A451A274_9GAMM|nr:MAG: 1,4-alpha-glucan branching enzyme [Candidatus Kentron sp. TUN]